MNKEILERHVANGASIAKIAKAEGLGYGTVQYWMKKHKIKTKHRNHIGSCLCSTCGETDKNKFYGHKTSMCKSCDNKRVADRASATRNKVIEHLGGMCVSCGFDESRYAFDVHHTDSSKKDSGFSNMSHWSWPRIENELKTCVLLCKNCHAMIHAGEIELPS